MKFEEFDAKEEDEEFQKFLQEATTKKSESKNEQKEFERIAITPEPAFCLKTKTIATSNENTGEKVFINVCTSTKIQAPRDISEHELIEIVKSEDPGRYRVPISLGEPVADIDKNGHGCSIFTVIIHPDYLKKARQSSTFMNFLLTLVYEGLENKFPMFKLETG
ncbi:unnamed protein product [Didymodactylos carnosus]|uniref:PIH1 N-terminal domain-containing protein n=1 Tax=Didymodactylos carnosus TaxID=1234261 RepID=A0A814KVN1_9BILA|nr:unnamed protein product [Didymodactylos carnosus]CAF1054848.1 unnamed protein product [Didymodactylos carnosus]CAF3544474.1 unnamed protein product [Didymodactylos carnosus]CAF3824026.1 unnamed protein product [Didymodactylos carnosus]